MKRDEESRPLLNRAAQPFVLLVERYYPDPFVFVVLLTIVTFAAALLMTDTGVTSAVRGWGGGMSALMAFIAQLALTLVSAHALAHTSSVRRVLRRVASIPRREWQAYSIVAMAAGLASLIAWPLGLVIGGVVAQRIARESGTRGLTLDYPLLVASAYSGFVVWHMGYSGSAPLFVATPGHALEDVTGLIPVSQTIFSAWNMSIALVCLVSVAAVCALMRPPKSRIKQIDKTLLHDPEEDDPPELGDLGFGARITHMRAGSLTLGLLLLSYLVLWFAEEGFSLNLNIVNWSLLSAGLILSRSPAHFVSLIVGGGQSLAPILIQYPFYAGIMGLMSSSGLVTILSDWFVQISDQRTLGIWAFLSGGLVNFFVPSGGGQWAIQGPVFIEAANVLDVDHALIVMAVAYGDQWSNMVQPFWTIPLLAIAGLGIRDVLGYTFVTFLVTSVVFMGGIYLASGILAT